MINYITTNSNLKRGICNYSKKICKGLNRPEMKFVCNMTYGIRDGQLCFVDWAA